MADWMRLALLIGWRQSSENREDDDLQDRRRISRFIESLVRPYVIGKDLEVAYQQMAREEAREAEALDWAEATVGDVADETR